VRGQANLAALAAALVVLTTTAGLAVAIGDGAFAGATRDPAEREAAVALAERLVAPDGPLTTRRNVLAASRTERLTASGLDRSYPVARGHDVRITLDGRTLVSRGDPTGGTTVRRIVLVAREQAVGRTPPLDGNAITIPRRTDRVAIDIDPPAGTTVGVVRANDRVVLRNTSGLDGAFVVRTSRFETIRLTFAAIGPLSQGNVSVAYYPTRTRKAILEVTVDA
jgi:hypothetical protein